MAEAAVGEQSRPGFEAVAHRAGWQVIAPLAIGPAAGSAALPSRCALTSTPWFARSTPPRLTSIGCALTWRVPPPPCPASRCTAITRPAL
eukprot:6697653-Alexandrium_andersonii.AAC.1